MKVFFTIFLFVVTSVGFAQKRDTSFLKNNGFVVRLRDSADYIRIVTQSDPGVKSYIVAEYYKSGKLKLEGTAITDKPLSFEGEVISYFENGKQKIIETYKNGTLLGSRSFFPNGKPYFIKSYNNDTEEIMANFDSLGTVLVADGNGSFEGYDQSFTYINEEGNIKDGKRKGEWKFQDGLNTRTEIYNDIGRFASGINVSKAGGTITYKYQEVLPGFPGGQKELEIYLSKNINYPKYEHDKKIGGRVLVQFIVEKNGKITNVTTENHITPALDKEAIRVIENSPTWIPGMQYGLPVRAQYTVPINFSAD